MTRLRPLHYIVIALMSLLAILAVAQYQRATLKLTETQIIEAYASQYLTLAGNRAKLTDCRAVPGQNSATRMVVICGPDPFDATRHYEFYVGPLGQLIVQRGPGDWTTHDPVAGREAA
ncbi:MAG: hypothetical protein AAGA08_05310 [Pseudomonadota bacterium]